MTDQKIFSQVDTNMCFVFEVPLKTAKDFCFGGGHPTNFQMVDWFGEEEYDAEALQRFLEKKKYIRKNRWYLVLTNFGEAFVFQGGDAE